MDNKKKSKKFILAIVAALLVLGAAILGFVLWYNLPINKINRAFEERVRSCRLDAFRVEKC